MSRRVAACTALMIALAACEKPPVGDTEPPVTRDTLPYRVESPAAGVIWREGETHVIRWTRNRDDAVNVGAVVGGRDKGHLAFALPAEADSLVWQVPVGFVTGFGPDRSDAVRIRVESADDPRIGAESAPFTIAGETAPTAGFPPGTRPSR